MLVRSWISIRFMVPKRSQLSQIKRLASECLTLLTQMLEANVRCFVELIQLNLQDWSTPMSKNVVKKKSEGTRVNAQKVARSKPGKRPNTKLNLLDAAELLFAKHGMSETSVRMIAAEATANVAAINFHFGGLDALKKAVLLRRFEPLIEERLNALSEVKSEVGRNIRVGDILRAWISPVVRMATSKNPQERAFVRVLNRALSDPAPEYVELIRTQLAPHIQVFHYELGLTAAHLKSEEITARFDFFIGAFGMANNTISQSSDTTGEISASRLKNRADQVVAFCEAGFEAASVKRSK